VAAAGFVIIISVAALVDKSKTKDALE